MPLAAIAAGIVVSRFVVFESRELLFAIAAFLILGVLSLKRRSRALALVCALLALTAAGALTDVLHRPGPPPEIDTGSRATLIVSGCVVEPPVFSDGREQFVLELEPGARARVSLYLHDGEAAPPLRYGQSVEFDAKLRKTRNFGNPGAFDYAGYLARKDIYWTASTSAGSTPTSSRASSPQQAARSSGTAPAMTRRPKRSRFSKRSRGPLIHS